MFTRKPTTIIAESSNTRLDIRRPVSSELTIATPNTGTSRSRA
ncbi:MAG: hypothetical protein R3E48_07830 [Burkholderiaceae bacterium]